ncbi:MAG: hypothetical protein WC337_00015 [Candidatus Muiribacteriota bacterium]
MEPIPKIIEKQLNEYLFLYKEHYEKKKDNEVLFLIYDILSSKDLYNLFILNQGNNELAEIIFSIISKRNDHDFILFFAENINSPSEKISFHSLSYLQENNFFKHYPELCREFINKTKHKKLIDIANYILNEEVDEFEIEEKPLEEKTEDIHKTKEVLKVEKPLKSKNNSKKVIDLTNLAEVSFSIKNQTFPGKKEMIFTALEKTSQIFIIRNLIYALNTEILKESEKKDLINILKKLNLIDELRYDLEKINIYTPVQSSSGVSFFAKVSTALTALIR